MVRESKGRNLRQVSGFTILEVLLALVLVTIGAVALTQLQAVTISSNTQTVQRYEAMRLAESLASRLQTDAYGWTDVQVALSTNLLSQAILESDARGVFHAFPSEMPTELDPDGGAGINSRGFPTGVGEGLGGGTPYCAYFTIAAPAAGAANDAGLPLLRQAEVRVYWARTRNAEPVFTDCVANGATIIEAGALEPGSGNTVSNPQGTDALRPLEIVSVRTVTLLQRNTWWNGVDRDDSLL